MKIARSLCLALVLVSPAVLADIFKCADGKGNEKYQNFPCAIDSIGSKATAAPPKAETGKPAPQGAGATTPPVSHRQPEPGMKMNDVRAAWGAPKSSRVIKGVEIWYYAGPSGNTRGVRFDRKGTVLQVNETEEEPSDSEDN